MNLAGMLELMSRLEDVSGILEAPTLNLGKQLDAVGVHITSTVDMALPLSTYPVRGRGLSISNKAWRMQ